MWALLKLQVRLSLRVSMKLLYSTDALQLWKLKSCNELMFNDNYITKNFVLCSILHEIQGFNFKGYLMLKLYYPSFTKVCLRITKVLQKGLKLCIKEESIQI